MAKEPRKGSYLTRESYYQYMIHVQDDIKNTGFDWRGQLFDKSISRYILSDTKRSLILGEIQKLLVYTIDKVSMIKKAMNYTVDKKYKYLN
jgi:hypothetical protein